MFGDPLYLGGQDGRGDQEPSESGLLLLSIVGIVGFQAILDVGHHGLLDEHGLGLLTQGRDRQ